jgi:hypothetical protein
VEEPSSEPRETKPANLVMLKTAASSLRDSIMQVSLAAGYGAPPPRPGAAGRVSGPD